ncbi:MAG: NAD-dependent epimerase/dehydratase family protein [Bradyrhizobiaceae bacterium]|nr:MAG: NAD-dependent epimerase/dehydratase family protein [Bradyrhizobiaceae bacterium]
MANTALIVGASGIVGNNLAHHLLAKGWHVHGLARRPPTDIHGLQPVSADLLDPAALKTALAKIRPSHVFLSTWMRQPTEAENIRVNGTMVRNVLDAVSPGASVQHVALVTGLKHYLGPFEAYGKGTMPPTPFREEQGRLDVENFYYAQEDEWNGLTDMTDARVLARHLTWAATTEAARNQAFNIVNGDVFRWSWMWQRIADWFGVKPAAFGGEGVPLETQLADAASIWSDIAGKYNLVERDLKVLASPWHTDADLGRPIEVVTDMSKSRKLGFLDYQATDDSFTDLFKRLKDARIIP